MPKGIVGHNYQSKLVGTLHKWIGENEYHNQPLALYSFGALLGGSVTRRGLEFNGPVSWFISSPDKEFIGKVISGVQKDSTLFMGMEVQELVMEMDKVYDKETCFFTSSPILVKSKTDKGQHHYTFKDEKVNELMTQTLVRKLQKAGLDAEGVSVQFDESYQKPKTKLIDYRGVKNRANLCPVLINGTSEQIAFARDTGIGNSTGIGFGGII